MLPENDLYVHDKNGKCCYKSGCTVNFVVHLVKSRLLELSLVLFHVVFLNYYYSLLFVISTICGE